MLFAGSVFLTQKADGLSAFCCGTFKYNYREAYCAGNARRRPSPLSHCFDRCRQAALVASRFVLVNDFLVSDRINHACGFAENSLCSSLVAGCNCLGYALDCCAQFGTQTGVMQVLLYRLSCTLSGLCCVCHVDLLRIWLAIKVEHYRNVGRLMQLEYAVIRAMDSLVPVNLM